MAPLALLLFMAQAPGQDATEMYRDAEAGLSIRLAGGFRFLKRQDTRTILGSNETPGVVVIEGGESFSSAELAEAARAGYNAEGVSLHPMVRPCSYRLDKGKGWPFR
jgi:hypothetical protein